MSANTSAEKLLRTRILVTVALALVGAAIPAALALGAPPWVLFSIVCAAYMAFMAWTYPGWRHD